MNAVIPIFGAILVVSAFVTLVLLVPMAVYLGQRLAERRIERRATRNVIVREPPRGRAPRPAPPQRRVRKRAPHATRPPDSSGR
jgi:hypothetical protein